ncbi:uncharacterized protein LOC111317021 [Durio zibethinus]|uniref:Uncharacterized protein LOC111317021 n=1 Tax=Durio zibethinus TaxID=66656 RepID=A0A6P6BD96_DURZI|nr:uncharacterized protein LOC111317021 [Durio zibethinus]
MLTRNSVSKTLQPTPVRRSARLRNLKTSIKSKDFNKQKVQSKENPARSKVKISRNPIKSSSVSANCVNSTNGLRRSPRLNSLLSELSTNCVNSTTGLRRSPRLNSVSSELSTNCVNSTTGLRKSPRLNSGSLSNKPEGNKFVATKKVESRKNNLRGGLLNEEKREEKRKEREICVDLKAVIMEGRESERREVYKRNEDVGVKGKRKRKPDEGGDAIFQGWTREQELALQKAYFSANPTPNFWKKVSKLVPGKSAQDCFDKIHSDHLTPTQPQPRSRAKRINLSPIEHLSFSASKLLKPTAPRNKRSSCIKQKSHLVQKKIVRHLLRKHYHVDQGDKVDLFSILEPNTSPSMHPLPNVMLSTPNNLLEKQRFLQKCHERSSVFKKHHSKLSNSCSGALISPPVLKPIKNRALHEKYINQLHSRDAKRKAESVRAEKEVLGKENRGSNQIQKIDKVRAAKNALVSDARYVINQLQHLQTNSVDNSLDFDNHDYDDDDDDDDDDEGEVML